MRAETLQPRPECPEPGRWTAPDDWASEDDVSSFLGDLVYLLKPDVVVETGSYLGFTTQQMSYALAELGRGVCISLETDAARAQSARERCARLPATVLAQSSLTYQPSQPIDLLFVDSDFPIRMAEVRHFQRWASPRCVIVAHDPAVPLSYPGVDIFLREMQAVVDEGLISPWLYLPTPRGLAMTRYR